MNFDISVVSRIASGGSACSELCNLNQCIPSKHNVKGNTSGNVDAGCECSFSFPWEVQFAEMGEIPKSYIRNSKTGNIQKEIYFACLDAWHKNEIALETGQLHALLFWRGDFLRERSIQVACLSSLIVEKSHLHKTARQKLTNNFDLFHETKLRNAPFTRVIPMKCIFQ